MDLDHSAPHFFSTKSPLIPSDLICPLVELTPFIELLRPMAQIHPDGLVSGKKKGFLIAVEDNSVQGFPKLYHAQRDAKELRQLLIEVFGYSEDDIVLMMDHKSIPRVLWPTRSNIRKQVQLFVQGVSAGDHLFFYYSGHGRQVPCDHHTESDGLDEEIYTCNGKEIMDNDLKKWLVDPLPRGCKLFALWDSCHSQTILDLDHYTCNEPGDGQCVRQCRESSPRSTFWRVLPKRFRRKGIPPVPRSAFTTAPHELRGRPISRASVSITAVSAGSSPPLSKWIPFSVENIQRVLSPPSWFKCNGNCPLPTEGDTKFAHVISLSACKDNESAFDDYYNGTVTKFFIDQLRAKPKSTLGELLLAIRQRVDKTTAARQAWDAETRVISRQTTFASGSRIQLNTEWTPRAIRRNTEVNVGTLEKFLQFAPSRIQEEDENEYSQKPCYSSHYRLNLDELVDI